MGDVAVFQYFCDELGAKIVIFLFKRDSNEAAEYAEFCIMKIFFVIYECCQIFFDSGISILGHVHFI